jgi:hypothetical protein
MSDDSTDPGIASRRKCIAAIRAHLGLLPADERPGSEVLDVPTFVAEADEFAIYQLLSITAALVRWMSMETGRTKREIVEGIARSNEQGLIFDL